MSIKNKVQLITYPDSLGGDIKAIGENLSKHFADCFDGGIHILPPFPSTGDRGFAPTTYDRIAPRFGSWQDVKKLGETYDIMIDIMINHISRQSEQFQDFLARGNESDYADLFITLDKVWPAGIPKQEEVDKIFLRRSTPFSTYPLASGGEVTVWTTFGQDDPSEQVDLDMTSPIGKEFIEKIFSRLEEHNITQVRMDAIGYITKKRGTNCFYVEPEIHQLLAELKAMAGRFNIEILPEIHADQSILRDLEERGFWVYDFVLPYMVLQSILLKDGNELKKYLNNRPHNQFTMLDCHDGIPVLPDLKGNLDFDKAREVVEICVSRGANISRILSCDGKGEDGFDVHQINGTFYSMVGADDAAYLAARALQLFTPGIPQVYYEGLLAGENDYESMTAQKDGRAINRHNYSNEEIQGQAQRKVVKNLLELLRFRNQHKAFDGDFVVLPSPDSVILLEWRKNNDYCQLQIDLEKGEAMVQYSDEKGEIRHKSFT